MTTLESLGFYDITKTPSDAEIARLQRVLREIEAAALRNNGPLASDHDSSTLAMIGRAAESLFDDVPKPDPHPTRGGIFRDHNCWKCGNGEKPCVIGNPSQCGFPHARND